MNNWRFFWDPLKGQTSLGRVIWLYGLVVPAVYSAFGLLFDVTDVAIMRIYTAGGLILSVYVTIATYRCAGNCRSVWVANLARISAILSLLLLPVLAYVALTGAIDLTSLRGEQ